MSSCHLLENDFDPDLTLKLTILEMDVPTDGRTPIESFFSENPRLLGLGRQIGPKNVGAFWVFSAKLQYSSWHCESLVHGLEYLVVVFTKKTLDFRPKTYNSQITSKYDIGRKEFKR